MMQESRVLAGFSPYNMQLVTYYQLGHPEQIQIKPVWGLSAARTITNLTREVQKVK
jgi:hypothetical protein